MLSANHPVCELIDCELVVSEFSRRVAGQFMDKPVSS